MSKELTPLEALDFIKTSPYRNWKGKVNTIEFNFETEIKIIENALKRLAVYENYGINLKPEDDVDNLTNLNGKLTYIDKVLDTQQRLIMSVSSEEINILSKVFTSQVKKVRKELKALEIIKELFEIRIGIDESENDKSCAIVFLVADKDHIWEIYHTFDEENIQKLKLLKEVLL